MAPPGALDAARASGLVVPGEPLLVMLSGGADSVCLLHVALELGARASALHVNYGLRAAAEQDESHCRALCERLGVELTVERVWLQGSGNLQEQARDARYRLAERTARGDYAAAHTSSDQAETVLYRLAASPGRRALLGMDARRGRLVRPLLRAPREATVAHCRARGLAWRDDESNADPRFARARVRGRLLSALRDVAPGAEDAVGETARQLREEAEVLQIAVDRALEELGGGPAVDLARMRELPRGLARLVLRALAEEAAGDRVAMAGDRVDSLLALGMSGGTSTLDVGGDLTAVAEYGMLRFRAGPEVTAPAPVELGVPGRVSFGAWVITAGDTRRGEVAVDAGALDGRGLTVRAWRDGDRLRPVGLGGTKKLQDLFTDRKVPRELRRSLPVVTCGEDVVWVAGVALDERYAASADAAGAVGLAARRAP